MNRNLFAAFYLFIAILIAACAKVSTPSGGARDRIPPVVVESIPEASAVNFKGDKLTITFNEYVVLDNINEKFMVSPPMKKKPRVFIKGKSVIAQFEETLKDSTTYTFYFQDAIKDLNEGNILQNYSFVLSTGPVVDSLTVTGNVYSSLNLEVPEKTQVLLYRELADSSVKKHLPDYISLVNENGYFRINNVKEGSYRLYALKDADNSKNYNLEDEDFAFADSVIRVTPEKNYNPLVKDTVKVKKTEKADTIPGEHQLILFKSLRKNHYLAGSSRDLKYKMQYFLSLPADTMPLEFSIPETGDDGYFLENNPGNDTITVWLTDSTLYSEQQISTIIRYPFTDTLGVTGQKEDTVIMRFIAPRVTRGRKEASTALSVKNNIVAGGLKPGQKIVFNSLTPLREPDTTLIRLYDESDTVRISVPYKLVQDSSTLCRYFLETNLIPGNKYFFLADSASFSNIYDEYTDSTGIKFNVKKADTYSKLKLNILNNKGDLIIHLMNKTENILEELYTKDSGVIEFPLLTNGFYRLRAIYDLNGDRKWTTGDFPDKRQPEPVSYYPGEIEIKTGWEVEQDWDLGVKNFKIQKLKEKKKAGR
jgi:hypothetical protein